MLQQDVKSDGPGAAAPASRPRRNFQIEDSIPGKIVRRWHGGIRYFRARAQIDALRRFEPILERFFENEWLAGTRVRLRFLTGVEEREMRIPWPGGRYLLRFRWMPWREEGCFARWSSPITAIVYKRGKDGGRRETVRYMSMFIEDRILHIAQLQGIPLIEMPKGLRDWAERFVKATMEFARQENYRGVWVARAEAVYSYYHPWVHGFLPPNAQERELKRIRSNIELHHNQTATELGFRLVEDWFRWENPDFRPR